MDFSYLQKEGKYREQKAWKRRAMERITHSVDSALTAAYIMTAHNMPKEVFIEDVIDRIAQLTKYQLQYSIYPEFDPVYRADRETKGGTHQNYLHFFSHFSPVYMVKHSSP